MEPEINEKFARDKLLAFADYLTADERMRKAPSFRWAQELRRNQRHRITEETLIRVHGRLKLGAKNTKKLELVLFNDTLKHLLKVIRIIRQPRSSALLVGVGGSGKQSLTRLSAFIQRMDYKQIELVKNYSEKDLKEDIKKYF